MTELLCRWLIKDRENVHQPAVRHRYGIMVSVVGILLNVLLAAGKYTVGLLFGAISIQADAVNNLSDAGSQIISLVSFKIAARPADHDHPFGHARIEYVASMIVSFAILLVGWELLSTSFSRILHPVETVFSWISVVVLSVSVLVKLWLFLFNRKVGKKIHSSVMRATAADSLGDAVATTAVLIATLLQRFTGYNFDAYMGICVAIIILVAGIKILNETKNSILGERPSEETVADVQRVVNAYPGALGIHDLVVHNYGPGRIMASLHIEVDGKVDIFTSHDMIDLIERQLRTECGIEATVHMDPIVTDDPTVDHLRQVALDAAHSIDTRLQIHDFRIVPGDTHTNMIFDVQAPFELTLSDQDIRAMLQKAIAAAVPQCFVVITVDRS